jgi:hypothetical protein
MFSLASKFNVCAAGISIVIFNLSIYLTFASIPE